MLGAHAGWPSPHLPPICTSRGTATAPAPLLPYTIDDGVVSAVTSKPDLPRSKRWKCPALYLLRRRAAPVRDLQVRRPQGV
uniref:Uncharacterized protein n=1 Tax=Zea mays TaxID=4577 RepID=A0A804LTT7_MAIZE